MFQAGRTSIEKPPEIGSTGQRKPKMMRMMKATM